MYLKSHNTEKINFTGDRLSFLYNEWARIPDIRIAHTIYKCAAKQTKLRNLTTSGLVLKKFAYVDTAENA